MGALCLPGGRPHISEKELGTMGYVLSGMSTKFLTCTLPPQHLHCSDIPSNGIWHWGTTSGALQHWGMTSEALQHWGASSDALQHLGATSDSLQHWGTISDATQHWGMTSDDLQ